MTTYVALLRGVNVGGKNKVTMKELREVCEQGLGWTDPRTVLASGNLVFETANQPTASLQTKLKDAVRQRFGVDCEVMMLTATEFRRILEDDPLDPTDRRPDWLTVMFVAGMPSAASQKVFRDKHVGPEQIEFGTSAIYIYYAEGLGRSKLSFNSLKPAVTGTVRNRKTLAKLQDALKKPD